MARALKQHVLVLASGCGAPAVALGPGPARQLERGGTWQRHIACVAVILFSHRQQHLIRHSRIGIGIGMGVWVWRVL